VARLPRRSRSVALLAAAAAWGSPSRIVCVQLEGFVEEPEVWANLTAKALERVGRRQQPHPAHQLVLSGRFRALRRRRRPEVLEEWRRLVHISLTETEESESLDTVVRRIHDDDVRRFIGLADY
jgi:predicted RNA polymerase sigma factor